MKPQDWHGFAHYAMYSDRQRRYLIGMDRGIIRLWHCAKWFVPTCLTVGAFRHGLDLW